MYGIISGKEEWLYPDSDLSEVSGRIELHSAQNGKEGFQVLLPANNRPSVELVFEGDSCLDLDAYEMVDVKVDYNSVENEVQDGQFVILEPCDHKPYYASRKAPFRTYEALRPLANNQYQISGPLIPLYIVISYKGQNLKEKVTFSGRLSIKNLVTGEIGEVIQIDVNLYPIIIPEENLRLTNWFSLDNMMTYHQITDFGSQEHLKIIRSYARAMRNLRQTHFYIELDYSRVYHNGVFDLSAYENIIEVFFDEGFSGMELGSFAKKVPSLFTQYLKCGFDEEVLVTSEEGKVMMKAFISHVKDFLVKKGWSDKTIFHVCDEPDVHVKHEGVMDQRKKDYFFITQEIKKLLPKAKIIEAVKTTEFAEVIDIHVPLTISYEAEKEAFNTRREEGDEVWTYVCCVPTGDHLNRFLDSPLLRSRLIFWGISGANLQGYLHWGLNMQPNENFDPFENSHTPNIEFNGLYPSGDAFIFYPGKEGPLIGMRSEAQRKGAEDYELLRILKEEKPEDYQKVIQSLIHDFTDYDDDVDHFESMRVELLKRVSGSL